LEAQAPPELGGLRASAVDDAHPDARGEELTHCRAHASREAGAFGGELPAHPHHGPPAGGVGERAHGQSPRSFTASVSSKPIITLKAWIACPAPPFTRLSSALKQTTRRVAPVGAPRVYPTST